MPIKALKNHGNSSRCHPVFNFSKVKDENSKQNILEQKQVVERQIEFLFEALMDGILIMNDRQEMLYANPCAQRILRQVSSMWTTSSSAIPEEIWYICQSLIESRRLFPHQHWLLESKIFVHGSVGLNISAQWIQVDAFNSPCVLLILKDQYQAIKNLAQDEAQQYGLTCREADVWIYHRAGYTYKQIALELCITPNTVKKHMKSIHAKRKVVLEPEAL
ncbi:MAG: helix-turn-helix transcriptional regulator [Cyanobacteria bacterium J06639_14]